MRALYDWMIRLAQTPYALWALAFVSFIESSIFPIPPDVMLIPMILAQPHRAFRIATVCTLASVMGGLVGYAIGAYAFEIIGKPIMAFYGYTTKFDVFAAWYNQWGAWAVLIAGVTPFPYKVVTILSGATGLDLVVFTVASLLARALRFFALAWLLWKFGPQIRLFIDRYFGILSVAFIVLLLGGFAVIKFL